MKITDANADTRSVAVAVGGATSDTTNDTLVFGGSSKTLNTTPGSASNVTIGSVSGVNWSYSAGKVLTFTKNGGGAFTADEVQALEKAVAFQTSSSATQGNRAFTFTRTDGEGNTSGGGTVTVLVDTVAPTQTVGGIDISNDTGSSATDFITNVAAQTITATLSAGLGASDKLEGSVDGGSSWVDITSKVSGTSVSWDGAELSATASTKSIVFRVVDAQGNAGTLSTAVTYTLDTTKPSTPTAALTSDSGISNIDGVTNSGAITAPTNAEGGAAVEYRVKKDAGNYSDWSSSYTAPATDGTADGSYTVQVRQTDTAGNVSDTQTLSFTLDTQAPGAVDLDAGTIGTQSTSGRTYNAADAGTALALAPSMAVGATDDVATLRVSVGGTGDATHDELFIGSQPVSLGTSSSSGTNLAIANLSGSTVNWAYDATNKVLDITRHGGGTFTAAQLQTIERALSFETSSDATQGSRSFAFSRLDSAHNASAGGTVTVAVDTIAPTTTASVTGLTDNVGIVTGTVSTGGVTDDTQLVITGTLGGATAGASLASGETVRVYDGSTYLGNATVTVVPGGLSTWSYTDTRTLSNGDTVSFTARVADTAGNQSAAGTAYTATIDTTAPTTTAAVTGLTDNVGIVTGTVSTGGVTDDTQLVITGTLGGATAGASLASGETVRVYDGSTYLGNATVTVVPGGQSTWSYADTRTLSNGNTVSFTARVADTAGNQSTAGTAYTATIDTTAPTTTASVTGLTDNVGIVTGTVSTGGVTDDTQLVITGTLGGATAGASLATGETVRVYDGSTYLGNATVTVVPGGQSTWSYTDTRTLSNGDTVSFTARVADTAGNQSAAGTAYTATIDTQAPTLHATTAPSTSLTTVAGTAGNSASETIVLTVTFDGNVDGLTSGTNSTIFRVGGTGVSATWSGTDGTSTRTLTYTIVSGQNGQATIDEDALKTALVSGIRDRVGNAFTYTGSIANIDSTSLPVIDTTAPDAVDLSATAGVQATSTLTYNSANAGNSLTLAADVVKIANADTHTLTVAVGGAVSDTTNDTLVFGAISKTLNTTPGSASNVTIGSVSGVNWSYSAGKVLTFSKNGGGAFTADEVQALEQAVAFRTSSGATQGNRAFTFTRTDGEGNTSNGGTVTVAVDTQVSVLSLALATDSGSSTSDGITNQSTVNVSGLEAGATWQYRVDGGAWQTGTGTSFALSAGTRSYEARQTDAANNTSAASSSVTFTLDTTAPTASGVALGDTDASGTYTATDTVTLSFSESVASTLALADLNPGAGRSFGTGAALTALNVVGGRATQFRVTLGTSPALSGGDVITVDRTKLGDTAGNLPASNLTFTLPDTNQVNTSSRQVLSLNSGTATDQGLSALDTSLLNGAKYVDFRITLASTKTGALQQLLSYAVGTVDNDLAIGMTADASQTVFNIFSKNTGPSTTIGALQHISVAQNLADGVARELRFVWDATSGTSTVSEVFVNGASIGRVVTASSAVSLGNTGSLFIGQDQDTNENTGFDGSQALKASIYDMSIATSTTTAADATTKARWNMQNGTGSTIVSTDGLTSLTLRDGLTGANMTATAGGPGFTTVAASSVTFSEDTGTPQDYVTQVATQTIGGQLTKDLAAGSKVMVSLNGGSTWTDATATVGSKVWSLSNATLLAGTNTLQVKVRDSANNDGPVYSQAYKLAPTTQMAGRQALALNTDAATDQALSLLNTNLLNGAKQVDLRMTVSSTKTGGLQQLLSYAVDAADNEFAVGMNSDGTTTTFTYLAKTTSGTITLARNLSDGNFHDLRFVWDATSATASTFQVYVDGMLVGTATAAALASGLGSTGTFVIGQDQDVGEDQGYDGNQAFRGLIQSASIVARTGTGGSDTVRQATWSLDGVRSNEWIGTSVGGTYNLTLRDALTGTSMTASDTAPRLHMTTTTSSLTFSDDTGQPFDYITGSSSQTISGTLTDTLRAGDTVNVSLDNGATWQAATATAGSRVWTLSGITLALGANTIRVKVTDQAGQDGPVFSTTYQHVVSLAAVAAGDGGFVVNGASAGDELSHNGLSRAGDVNGDGYEDFILGAHAKDSSGSVLNVGEAYVIFGKPGTSAVNAGALGTSGGFRISNSTGTTNSYLGIQVMGGGDFNADGLADLVVSEPGWTSGAGRVYVVYGKTTSNAVDLNNLGTGGFTISGAASTSFQNTGYGLAVGDINGDGISDIVVRKQWETFNSLAGDAYVIFGSTTQGSTPVTLGVGTASAAGSITGASGFVVRDLNSSMQSDWIGKNTSVVGDVNGDGMADFLLGSIYSDSVTTDAGRAYLVFGKTNTDSVTAANVASGLGGFVISPEADAGSRLGMNAVGLGDVNGDGLADFAVSAYLKDQGGLATVGRTYVVFGKTNTSAIDLAVIASGVSTQGFAILGEAEADAQLGVGVSSAGDINGDGLADIIVGAHARDLVPGSNAGRSYVVYGKSSGTNINLSSIAQGNVGLGFVIDGTQVDGLSGRDVSAAGDINGDGFDDLLVGGTWHTVGTSAKAGQAFVIFGGSRFMTTVDYLGDTGNNTQTGTTAAETFVAGDGNDTLTSGGGADVMYGGRGNDVFVINSSMAEALATSFGNGGNAAQLARINGGTGIDTLRLSGGMGLDLTAISNVQMGGSRIESIERIDMSTDAAINTLRLSLQDVLDMSSINAYSSVQRHQLLIDGGSNDVFNHVGGSSWSLAGEVTLSVSGSSQTYNVWNHNTAAAQLLIDADIFRNAVL